MKSKQYVFVMAMFILAGWCGMAGAGDEYVTTLTGMSGLVSYWNLNEAAGTTAADSVTGDAVDGDNPGTYSNIAGVTVGQAGPRPSDGFYGFSSSNNAPEFNGAGYHGELRMATYLPYDGRTELSMVVWMWIDANARRCIGGLQQYNGGGGRYVFTAAHYENNNPTPGIQSFIKRTDDSVESLLQSRTPISFGEWHMWVMTFEGGNKADSYLDGVWVDGDTTTDSFGLFTPEALLFGVDIYDGSRDWKGGIDEIAIFDRAITAEEVEALWEAAVAGTATGPDPYDGQVGVNPGTILDWADNPYVASYDVFFGTDETSVANATRLSSEYQGNVTVSDSSALTLSPAMVESTDYFWRIDTRDGSDQLLVTGDVWQFQTGGLMAWWEMDDAGATATDSTSNGNDGVLNGDPTWTTGLFGGAIDLDADDYIQVPDANSLQVGYADLTLSAWVKLHDVTSDVYKFIYCKRSGTYNTIYLIVHKPTSGGFFRFAMDDDGASPSSVQIDSSIAPLVDTWYHVAVVVDRDAPGNSAIYVNGVNTTVAAVVENPGMDINIASDVFMGKNTTFEDYFNGVMDDVRFYNYALTPAEVTALYEATPQAQYPQPADQGNDQTPTVPLDTSSCSWTPNPAATSHNVYIDFDPDLSDVVAQNVTSPTISLSSYMTNGLLPQNTTFYWRVDEVTASDTFEGSTWSFTTKALVCSIGPEDGDLDGDCVVTLEDFAIMASNWLYCGWDLQAACP